MKKVLVLIINSSFHFLKGFFGITPDQSPVCFQTQFLIGSVTMVAVSNGENALAVLRDKGRQLSAGLDMPDQRINFLVPIFQRFSVFHPFFRTTTPSQPLQGKLSGTNPVALLLFESVSQGNIVSFGTQKSIDPVF